MASCEVMWCECDLGSNVCGVMGYGCGWDSNGMGWWCVVGLVVVVACGVCGWDVVMSCDCLVVCMCFGYQW